MPTFYVVSKDKGLEHDGFTAGKPFRFFRTRPTGTERYFNDPARHYNLYEYRTRAEETEIRGSTFVRDVPPDRIDATGVHLPPAREWELEEGAVAREA